MIDDPLELLLAYDDGPADALPASALAGRHEAAAAQKVPDHLRGVNDDIDDLTIQRYCVVVPEGDRGRHLRDVAAPLLQRRGDEQGKPVEAYTVPPRMSLRDANLWLARLRAGFSHERDVPRYFLLLGDLDEVPLSLQQALALADDCPGRLAFDGDDDLRTYVSRAVAQETSEPRPTIALHAAATDRTIEHAQARLLGPMRDQLRYRYDLGELPAAAISDVTDLAVSAARPFLFSLTHGYGGDRQRGFTSPEARRREQGALVLQHGARLTADQVRSGPFLRDGFWFMFACYGAGTPDDSAFAPWLRELAGGGDSPLADAVLRALPAAGERPFVAALPRAALANPEGPLACFGHVDVAWQYAYSDADPTVLSRPTKFTALVEDACRGRRAGSLARSIARAAADAANDLAAEAELARRDPDSAERRRRRVAHLWMLRNDLSSYVLLGDPALRLRASPSSMSSSTGPKVQAKSAAPAVDLPQNLAELARKLGAGKLEEAFARALVSEPAQKVARKLGLELADLRALEDIYRAAGRKALGLE